MDTDEKSQADFKSIFDRRVILINTIAQECYKVRQVVQEWNRKINTDAVIPWAPESFKSESPQIVTPFISKHTFVALNPNLRNNNQTEIRSSNKFWWQYQLGLKWDKHGIIQPSTLKEEAIRLYVYALNAIEKKIEPIARDFMNWKPDCKVSMTISNRLKHSTFLELQEIFRDYDIARNAMRFTWHPVSIGQISESDRIYPYIYGLKCAESSKLPFNACLCITVELDKDMCIELQWSMERDENCQQEIEKMVKFKSYVS